jgi:hypothetical protein
LLHLACEHGQANLLRELIEGGLVDVNRNGKQGMELAIKYAYRDVMTVLLHRGVSVNEESLLHSAIEHGSIATVKFLLERGAELSEEVLEWCQTQLHEKHAKGLLTWEKDDTQPLDFYFIAKLAGKWPASQYEVNYLVRLVEDVEDSEVWSARAKGLLHM